MQSKLKQGIDIFYMKGAFFAPLCYPQFLPQIARNIRGGGWLMTADNTSLMESVNPEPCLGEKNGLTFTQRTNHEIQTLIEHTFPPFTR